jgi:glycosyltransferase involved in cell wall biosynthesis
MKLLYVACTFNPIDHNSGSGLDYDYYHLFKSEGVELQLVGPFLDHPSPFEHAYREIHSLFSDRSWAKHSMAFISDSGKKVTEAAKDYQPDVVFSCFSAPLVKFNPDVPVVYMIDTSLKGYQEQWHFFSKFEYLRMLNWEINVIKKSSRIITSSEWSANIIRDSYHVPEERINFWPASASLPSRCIPKRGDLASHDFSTLRLLLVGRQYERKGVDIALKLVELLQQKGINVEMHVVGVNGQDTNAKFYKPYNKTIPSELDEYVHHYQWAHFLIHPARFEAAGIVPSEAAAFGIPTITNAVGGLATTVLDGVSGVVLPSHSSAGEYLNVLLHYLEHPEEYICLRQSTRLRYENELNWDVVGRKVMKVINEAITA